MDPVNLGHSTKDIPVPSIKVIKNMIISSSEKFFRSLDYKVFFFLNPRNKDPKENYQFNSIRNPPKMDEIQPFKDSVADLIKNIEYEEKQNDFQNKLKAEVKKIQKDENLIVAADKTSNHYRVKPADYKKLIEKNIHKDYKKELIENVDKVNQAHKVIVNSLEIQDRVFETTKRESFISLKDHKEDFKNSPSCRLLNPYKCEIGKISHQKLSKVVTILRQKTKLNHWKNVYSCIDWFKNVKNKNKASFIVLDIVNFYPSITLDLLKNDKN